MQLHLEHIFRRDTRLYAIIKDIILRPQLRGLPLSYLLDNRVEKFERLYAERLRSEQDWRKLVDWLNQESKRDPLTVVKLV